MLDIALLTANASQLKYILQVGHKHEFYTLMLGLITTSLILQVSLKKIFLFLSLFFSYCRSVPHFKFEAFFFETIILQVLVGILLLSLNFMRDCKLHLLEYKNSATYINYFTTGVSIAITAINLLISAFDPSLARFTSSIDLNNNNNLMSGLGFLRSSENNWKNITTRR